MKIIIAGCGKVGETLVKQLSAEGCEITVIDTDSEVLSRISDTADVITLNGNCASAETLRRAGLEKADLLIATTGGDEVNLLSCMTARVLNQKIHTISRIRNPEYSEQAYSMSREFALSMIFNPEKQAATEIERLIRFPGFLKRDTFSKGRVEIVELKIDADSKLCGKSFGEIEAIVRCKVLICVVLRQGEAIITPSGQFRLLAGDRIFVTADSNNLSLLIKNLGLATRKVRKVMIVGGGTISYYLASMLADRGIDVKIIEKDEERAERIAERFRKHVTVAVGDACSEEVLEREGLAEFDTLVTLTGMDESNIIVSIYGSNCGIPQIITKITRIENSKVTDTLPIGSVVCPRKLCCNTIVQYVRAMKNQTGSAISLHKIADGETEALEFAVEKGTLNCNVPLKSIRLREGVLIACITRSGVTEIPNGDSVFRPGDTVVIVAGNNTVIKQLNDIFA